MSDLDIVEIINKKVEFLKEHQYDIPAKNNYKYWEVMSFGIDLLRELRDEIYEIKGI